jgi:hypothetical protein
MSCPYKWLISKIEIASLEVALSEIASTPSGSLPRGAQRSQRNDKSWGIKSPGTARCLVELKEAIEFQMFFRYLVTKI